MAPKSIHRKTRSFSTTQFNQELNSTQAIQIPPKEAAPPKLEEDEKKEILPSTDANPLPEIRKTKISIPTIVVSQFEPISVEVTPEDPMNPENPVKSDLLFLDFDEKKKEKKAEIEKYKKAREEKEVANLDNEPAGKLKMFSVARFQI